MTCIASDDLIRVWCECFVMISYVWYEYLLGTTQMESLHQLSFHEPINFLRLSFVLFFPSCGPLHYDMFLLSVNPFDCHHWNGRGGAPRWMYLGVCRSTDTLSDPRTPPAFNTYSTNSDSKQSSSISVRRNWIYCDSSCRICSLYNLPP